ncbi:hypothetical protein J2T17_001173 [Paenibacillus mucilaginosus]|uniref:hypothetical protein n=1 Tax=Paenibacillus mucilaginosus TaxID=61624 RepID=UPI003D1A915B
MSMRLQAAPDKRKAERERDRKNKGASLAEEEAGQAEGLGSAGGRRGRPLCSAEPRCRSGRGAAAGAT